MQDAGGPALPMAIMRVCSHCNRILGAKNESTNKEIPLSELGSYGMHLRGDLVVTGGICPRCFKEQTGSEWPGEQT